MSRVDEHGQPIGAAVDWVPRPAPVPVTLAGRTVRLEPLSPAHVDDLWAVVGGPDHAALWTYLADEQPGTREGLQHLVEQRLARTGTVTLAVLVDGAAAGLLSLMRIDAANGSVEIGGILLGRPLQRTRAATETMALVARHVFDDLGYRRYEWKCDSLNGPSRRAALRLGFVWEGRFRNALVTKGRNRDTDWFSIIDTEWPALARAYDAWLADDNFDADGRQRQALGDLTRRGAAGR